QDDDPVRPGALPAVADLADRLGREVLEARIAAVENGEVVSRPRHLVEDGSLLHTFPQIASHRSRHTIQTASQMIALDILLEPSSRSVNVIGISFSRNFRFQARNDISIWKE